MAIGRISIKSGSKGKGLPHAKYIMREDKYASRAEKLEKLESVGHGNMPSWAKENPKFLWEMADEHERKNGSVYREHIISLPREMNESQRLELVQDWIKNEIGDKHPYSYAIHNPLAMDGKEQPHCHLMICERTLDGIDRGADQFFKRYNSKDPTKGGAKKANTGLDHATRKEQIKQQRDRWEKMCNKHLERIGSRERVSLKNYKERGLEQPQNISMTDMLKPEIKQAYKDKLTARAELKTATFEIYNEIGRSLALEIHRLEQRITKNKDIQNETATQNQDSEQRPIPPTSETNQRTTRGADSLQQNGVGLSQSSIQRTSGSEKQGKATPVSEPKSHTIIKTHRKPIETRKNQSSTIVPPNPRKSPQRAVESNIEVKRKLLSEYQEKAGKIAKKIHTQRIAEMEKQRVDLVKQSNPLLAKYQEIVKNEPLIFGRAKWEQDKQTALVAYNEVKDTHDDLKQQIADQIKQGASRDDWEKAYAVIVRLTPTAHEEMFKIQEEIRQYDEQQAEILSQQQDLERQQRQAQQAQNTDKGKGR